MVHYAYGDGSGMHMRFLSSDCCHVDLTLLHCQQTHQRSIMAASETDAKSRSGSDDKTNAHDNSFDGREDIEEKQFSAPENEDGAALKPPFSPVREAIFVFTICMAQFLALAGLAQSIAPLLILGRSFSVTAEGLLSWYSAAFSLTVGTFILPAGRLGDMYGHRNVALVGYTWYALWSVIAGVAVYSGDIIFSFSISSAQFSGTCRCRIWI